MTASVRRGFASATTGAVHSDNRPDRQRKRRITFVFVAILLGALLALLLLRLAPLAQAHTAHVSTENRPPANPHGSTALTDWPAWRHLQRASQDDCANADKRGHEALETQRAQGVEAGRDRQGSEAANRDNRPTPPPMGRSRAPAFTAHRSRPRLHPAPTTDGRTAQAISAACSGHGHACHRD